MTAPVAEFNISDLVRNPSRVIEQAERGEVILHRRGRADLKLSLASRETDSTALNEFLARFVSGLMQRNVEREAIRETFNSAYPWLRFLPADGQDECIQELLDVALACASIRNFAPLHGKVASWRSTAEIYADPELYAKLTGPVEIEHGGRVPMPEVS